MANDSATSASPEFCRRRPKPWRKIVGVALRAVLGQAKGTRGLPLLARIQGRHAGGAGWNELAGVELVAAAGVRAPEGLALWCMEGGAGGCNVLLGVY